MSNIFASANLAVQEQKYLKSAAMPDSSMMVVYESMVAEQEAEENERKLQEDEHNQKVAENANLLAAAASIDGYIMNLSTKLYMEGKEVLFKDIMTNIYLESVYLDDEFKLENAGNLKEVMADYLDKNGGFTILETACKKSNNKVLKNMKNVIEGCARTAALRKTKELQEACTGKNRGAKALEVMNQKHSFDLNDDELVEYNKTREKLSEDEIINLVRDKVLDVVKDESERQRDIEAFEQELEDKVQELGTEKEKAALKESVMHSMNHGTFVDTSLFESINVSTMKEMMDELKNNDVEESVNMDLVMAESIAKYTLLEVMNTLCLESFSRADVERLCMQLIGK